MKSYTIIGIIILLLCGLSFYLYKQEIKKSYELGYKDGKLSIKSEVIKGETKIDTVYLPAKNTKQIIKIETIKNETAKIDTFVISEDQLASVFIKSDDIINDGLIIDLYHYPIEITRLEIDTIKIVHPQFVELPPKPIPFIESWTSGYIAGIATTIIIYILAK